MTASGPCTFCGVATGLTVYKGKEFIGWFCKEHYPDEHVGDRKPSTLSRKDQLIVDKLNAHKSGRDITQTDAALSTFHRHKGWIIEIAPVAEGFMHGIHYGTQVFSDPIDIATDEQEALSRAKTAINLWGHNFERDARKAGTFRWEKSARIKRAIRAGVL